MSAPASLPCGAWPSPLSAELAAAGGVSLSYAGGAGGSLYWIEGRPAEGGRSALMTCGPDGVTREVLGPTANVRSRVHEYGGTPWLALGEQVVWSEFADQQLRLRRGDGSVSVLTPPGCRYVDADGAADGGSLVCVREDHRQPGEARNAVVALRLDGPEGGHDAGQVLFDGSNFVAAPRLSADGGRLALVAWDHPDMPWDGTRLLMGEMPPAGATGLQAVRVVAGGAGESVLDPQWDADGSLYFLSDRSGWWNLYRWRDGHPVEAVTALQAEVGAPLWNLGQRAYALTGDGRALLRVSRDTVDTLWLLDLATGDLQSLDLPFVAFGSPGLRDADTACVIASAADALPALITVDLRTGSFHVVRSAGKAPLVAEAVSRAQAISFPTAPGPGGQERQARAWFYPPRLPGVQPMPGELPPLVVLLHGGPTSAAGPAFKVGVQFWTTRGFAVVDVNYGGSSGFGRAYRERLNGQWGVVDLQDAIAAVDYLAGSGLVDGQRVVIRGGSAGGFTVLSALAFSQRFAAGINYYGVADLESLASDTHKFESRYLDRLVAPLPEGIETYRARSPVHHMGRSRGALITFQGSDDRAVPPQQSREIVAAARAAGCAVAYIEFEGEGHGFRRAENIVRALQAELAFLGRVLGHRPAEQLPAIEIDNLAAR